MRNIYNLYALPTFTNMDTTSISQTILTVGCSQNNNQTTMDAYVGVSNDVSLAVKSILQVKKAFRTQMKCIKDLTKKNKLLQQRNCQLENRNKDLKNKLSKLKSDNKKQETIVSDLQEQLVSNLIRETNGVDVFSDVFVIDNKNDASASEATSECVNRAIPGVNVNSEHKEKPLCPSSPTTANKQRSKRKVTPKKKTLPRKSRRLSNRE